MEHILDYLCDAPIGSNALPHAPGSPAAENLKARHALLEQLRVRLAPEEAAMLDAYFALEEQSEEDFAGQKFQYGFCLGASLLLEVLEGRERLLR